MSKIINFICKIFPFLTPHFVKFVFVGGLNTVFSLSIFYLGLWLGLHYTLATLISNILGILFNFKSYGRIVFKDKSNIMIFRYFVLYTFLWIGSNIFIFVLKKFGISPYLSGFFWVFPNAVVAYFASQKWIYNQKINENSMENQILNQKNRPAFWVFIAVAFIALISIFWMSQSAGMNGDEGFQRDQAENVYNYYSTFGKDTAAVHVTPEWNLPFYGQVGDNLAYAIWKWTGQEFDEMNIRHGVNAIFGWLAMLFSGLIAYAVSKKWYAAIITFVLLFFSPRFLGHSFNDIKDVAFASMMLAATYFMLRFFQKFKENPKVPIRIIIGLALTIGLAIGIRVGGILLIAYMGLFAIVWLIKEYVLSRSNSRLRGNDRKKTVSANKAVISANAGSPSRVSSFKRLLVYGLIVSAVGLLIALLLWPFALKDPFHNITYAFKEMSHFASSMRQVWEGNAVWSDMFPWYYTPKYIFMTIPIAVIIGFILSFFFSNNKNNRFEMFIVYFTVIFPIFWIVYSKANVYGGWRHAMFAYLPMVVLAGLGFNSLVEKIRQTFGKKISASAGMTVKTVVSALPFLLLITPILHVVKNHPYEYVYFNEFVGGVKNAYGNYEMDYYYHSTREATEWVMKDAAKQFLDNTNTKKIKVATWHTASVGYFLKKDTAHFQCDFSRWYQRSENDWDYAVFTITGIDPYQLKSEFFPPKNTVYQVKVDNTPICIVLKREDYSGYIATQFKQNNQIDSAVFYYEKAIQYDPYDEVSLGDLADIYFQTGK
ncbi:MAG: GtrA family protein, partial [Bacteroidales bacterium]|nr:GtrA family protein [Bacteroidales bacterium]